jgi:repressor LexA
MKIYFRVTPPAVHDMVLKLEKHGFLAKEPGVPRSIRLLLLKREELPDLE